MVALRSFQSGGNILYSHRFDEFVVVETHRPKGRQVMTAGIKILVVDDHALVRGALSERLRKEPRFAAVESASSADEAVEKVLECKPDIVLLDIEMPGLSSFEAARAISQIRPETSVVFLSAFLHDGYVQQAFAAGARGYLTKQEPLESVVAAIIKVASGGSCFSQEVLDRISIDSQGAVLISKSKSRAATLTARELDVLRYIAQGMAKKEIAQTMQLSVKTIDRHSSNLMSKLDIHDRVKLTLFAVREGLSSA